MSIDINKLIDVDGNGKRVVHAGFNSHIRVLGWVCTGRMVENLSGTVDSIYKELTAWIEALQQAEDGLYSALMDRPFSYIFYKPQILIAVTNNEQGNANSALKKLGFIPSPPTNNTKYMDCELITWTLALHGWSDKEINEVED